MRLAALLPLAFAACGVAADDIVVELALLPLEGRPLETALPITLLRDGTTLGGVCDGRRVRNDQPRATVRACGVVDAAALHLVVTNQLGLRGAAVVADRFEGPLTRSQPILDYHALRVDEVSARQAADCIGDGERSAEA